MKELYTKPEAEVVEFDPKDTIVTSIDSDYDDI